MKNGIIAVAGGSCARGASRSGGSPLAYSGALSPNGADVAIESTRSIESGRVHAEPRSGLNTTPTSSASSLFPWESWSILAGIISSLLNRRAYSERGIECLRPKLPNQFSCVVVCSLNLPGRRSRADTFGTL